MDKKMWKWTRWAEIKRSNQSQSCLKWSRMLFIHAHFGIALALMVSIVSKSRYGRRSMAQWFGCLQRVLVWVLVLAFAHADRIRTTEIMTMEGHAQNAYHPLRKALAIHSPDKYTRYSGYFFRSSFILCCTAKVLSVRLPFVRWHFFGLLSFD